jgi:protoporphyrinogen/coproporphyrinogen III oxidase
LAALILCAACVDLEITDPPSDDEAPPFVPSRGTRIAVVGAGPAGLMAALQLRELGYRAVTVFEKNDRVGGKAYSWRDGDRGAELGAILASDEYHLVLGLADRFGIPYVRHSLPTFVVGDAGEKVPIGELLARRHDAGALAQATAGYAVALSLFAGTARTGLANMHPDLYLSVAELAAKYGFTPILDLAAPLFSAYGYGHAAEVPALYWMKMMPWVLPVGAHGVELGVRYVFPTGFQSLWTVVARQLDVRLSSEVTAIERRRRGALTRVELTINGVDVHEFDLVVIAVPLDRVASFLDVTPLERELFAKVRSERYITTVFAGQSGDPDQVVLFESNAVPQRRGHVNGSLSVAPGLFQAWQLADAMTPLEEVTDTLARDLSGRGARIDELLVKEVWDYFPRVGRPELELGFYERLDALQGRNGTLYVGGTLGFESVEHSARQARELVLRRFPATR